MIELRPPVVRVDWKVPADAPDAMFGDGATSAEKLLPNITGAIGCALLVWYAAVTPSLEWGWWRYLLALVVVFDLVGGVVANGLNSAKRFQHAEAIPTPRFGATLVRNHVLFTALHVQAIVVALLFPGGTIWWGVCWYAVALGAVYLVLRVPLYLRRPAALAFVAVVPMLAAIMHSPHGFAWLPAVLVAKLVLGAVREEPYRPLSDGH